MIETNWCSYVYLLSMFPHREQTAPHREQTAPSLLKKIIFEISHGHHDLFGHDLMVKHHPQELVKDI